MGSNMIENDSKNQKSILEIMIKMVNIRRYQKVHATTDLPMKKTKKVS
jgi:hypothetical protein